MTGKIMKKPRNTKKNDVLGTGRGIVISTFSNEMEKIFSRAMEQTKLIGAKIGG